LKAEKKQYHFSSRERGIEKRTGNTRKCLAWVMANWKEYEDVRQMGWTEGMRETIKEENRG